MSERQKRRLSAAERRAEIVRVAIDLAAQRGVDSVTTQHMAQAMGLTQGAIFRHFQTKDDIWVAVMDWIRERLGKVISQAIAGESNPLEALRKMFLAHVEFISEHPAIPRLLFSEHLHIGDSKLNLLIRGIIEAYEARVANLLELAKQSGLADSGLEVKSAATLYIGMIQGLVLLTSIFRGKRNLLEEAKKTFPVYLDGIRPRN